MCGSATAPKSITERKELVAKVAAPAKTLLPAMRENLGVRLEQASMGGVNILVLTPQAIAPEKKVSFERPSPHASRQVEKTGRLAVNRNPPAFEGGCGDFAI